MEKRKAKQKKWMAMDGSKEMNEDERKEKDRFLHSVAFISSRFCFFFFSIFPNDNEGK